MRAIRLLLTLCTFVLLGISCQADTTSSEIQKLLEFQTKEQWEESLRSSHFDIIKATSAASPHIAKRLQDFGVIKAVFVTYPLPQQVVSEVETRPGVAAIVHAIRDLSLEPAHADLWLDTVGQRMVKITYSDGRDVQIKFVDGQPKFALVRATESSCAIYSFTRK